MIPSLRYGSHKNMTQTQSFTGFESNLLTNLVSLFHCAVCNVFLLFGPSTMLMSLNWKTSLSWVTVTVTVPCTCLPTTILMRSSLSDNIMASWSSLCKEANEEFDAMLRTDSDLAHLADKMFFVWEGNHHLTAWWRHVNKYHSVKKN